MTISVIEYSILLECSNFINESRDIPVLKFLSPSTKLQDKIKIRLKSQNEEYHSHIDNTLNFKNFKNRSLECYLNILHNTSDDNLIPYYVFLPDGYKYMYSNDNIDINFKDTFEKLSMNLSFSVDTYDELLKYMFNNSNLTDGLENNDKITFYDIPYYYCIRADKPFEEVINFYGNIQD